MGTVSLSDILGIVFSVLFISYIVNVSSEESVESFLIRHAQCARAINAGT